MLNSPPSISDPPEPAAVARPHGTLTFENISFRYGDGTEVLKDVSLAIPHGETLAIVGPNGCGKSTLANLVPRFHDPSCGAVRLDGIDIRDLKLRDLRSRIALVSQQTLLFDDTIAGNIRYGSPAASDEEVERAARQADVHEFIANCELGYQTQVGPRGEKLSGGQRQKIALARAILRDAEILILDEATSQVDIESEHQVHKVLKEFVVGRTAIIITHRLSTLSLADRILVMDSGRILDLGTHEQLLQRCDVYQRLQHGELKKSA
jgi:ATP-binding cassette subfamily B protein/subfamily B ATP-binding cassette protein MsbA